MNFFFFKKGRKVIDELHGDGIEDAILTIFNKHIIRSNFFELFRKDTSQVKRTIDEFIKHSKKRSFIVKVFQLLD